MKRIFFLHLALLFLFSSICCQRISEREAKMNVLFIAIDDLRPELGCYGVDEIITPNIDKIANDGAVFMNAYCNASVCGASRASLMTSMYPIPNKRFINYLARADKEVPQVATLAEHLKASGYYTISNGKIFHHQDDSPQSWSEPAWRPDTILGVITDDDLVWHNPLSIERHDMQDKRGPFYDEADVPDNAYADGQITDRTIEDLRRLAKMDKPFFLGFGLIKPHLPFNAPKKYWDLYDRNTIPTAENQYKPKDAPKTLNTSRELTAQYSAHQGFPEQESFHRLARHGYFACVSYVDAQVGRVMDELEALGLAENTIVVLWGDHGWHLGEHNFWGKHNTLDNASRVPLIIKAPGIKKGARKQLVEFVDLYPTICELSQLTIPEHCQGSSILDVLVNPQATHKSVVYPGFKNMSAVKTKDFLYTQWYEKQWTFDTPIKSRMMYDHRTDREENHNISEHPDYAEVVKDLSTMLEVHLRQVVE